MSPRSSLAVMYVVLLERWVRRKTPAATSATSMATANTQRRDECEGPTLLRISGLVSGFSTLVSAVTTGKVQLEQHTEKIREQAIPMTYGAATIGEWFPGQIGRAHV